MMLRVGICSVPKRGNSTLEYEDAYFPDAAATPQVLPFSCAVADGATEMSFSGIWARLLVEGFVSAHGDLKEFETTLPELRERWRSAATEKPLAWYAEEKLELGAFSALLGLTVNPESETDARWRAFSVGDTCLFHFRGDVLVGTFPAQKAADLQLRPTLISSRTGAHDELTGIGKGVDGTLTLGDTLVIVTDALAACLLQDHEEGGRPWLSLKEVLDGPDCFERWVDDFRDRKLIKNDDCTLLWLEAVEGVC